jgi:reactive intermediate/imine deaminase
MPVASAGITIRAAPSPPHGQVRRNYNRGCSDELEEPMRTKPAPTILVAFALVGATALAAEKPTVKRTNPPTLSKPTGYTHVVEVTGGRTVYVAGQVALDPRGELVGKDDLKAQTRQVFENLKAALAAADASLDHVVKITVFMTDASDLQPFREVRNSYFAKDLPASTLVQVVRLARPEFLIEIEAVAAVE